MEYKRLIKFYKGYVLVKIYDELNKKDTYTLNELDMLLKYNSQIQKSCTEMNYYELQELIIWSFIFGDQIGIYLNFNDNEFE